MKKVVGTTFSEVLEYAQIIVEKASTKESIIEFCRVNLCSKQTRKKIAADNAEKTERKIIPKKQNQGFLSFSSKHNAHQQNPL